MNSVLRLGTVRNKLRICLFVRCCRRNAQDHANGSVDLVFQALGDEPSGHIVGKQYRIWVFLHQQQGVQFARVAQKSLRQFD